MLAWGDASTDGRGLSLSNTRRCCVAPDAAGVIGGVARWLEEVAEFEGLGTAGAPRGALRISSKDGSSRDSSATSAEASLSSIAGLQVSWEFLHGAPCSTHRDQDLHTYWRLELCWVRAPCPSQDVLWWDDSVGVASDVCWPCSSVDYA